MATINLTVGLFRSRNFLVRNADGTTNVAMPLGAQSGNDTKVRVKVNPSDNRQVGIMALQPGASNNATVIANFPGNPQQSQDLVVTQTPTGNQEALLPVGDWSAESDPPAWMLTP